MGRLDWKHGRFDTDWETQDIHRGLRGWQSSQVGNTIDYFRFWREQSEMDDVYDEGSGAGKVWHPAVALPVLHVAHDEGGNEDGPGGFYFNSNIYITASFDQVSRTGLTLEDLNYEDYLKDRMAYDGRLWRVVQIHILGQIQSRDLVVSIEGTQIKPDELVNDPMFTGQDR